MTIDIRRDYYVYVLLDPSNDYLPFYVGKGTYGNGKSRVTRHLNPSSLKINHPKNDIINNYLSLGFSFTYIILHDNLTNKESYDLEKIAINFFKRKIIGGLLTNQTNGGGGDIPIPGERVWKDKDAWRKAVSCGMKGNIPSEAARENLSKAGKGKRPSDLCIQNSTKARIGKPKTIKQIETLINRCKGKKLNPEHKEKVLDSLRNSSHKGKWFKLTSPNGDVWIVRNKKEFAKEFNLNHAGLSSVANGSQKHHRNWLCEYFIPTKEILEEYERSGNPKSYKKIWFGS